MLWACLLGMAAARPTLYFGGPIHTVDPSDRTVEAMLIDQGWIVAVGDEDALRRQAPRAREVDLGGRAVVPGFIDAHGHFPGEGVYASLRDLNSPPIGTVEDIDGLVAQLRDEAAQTRRGKWVVGLGYDDTLLAEGRHPTRHDLDKVSAEHPVAAIHISGHLTALNSVALNELGLSSETPDPPGGRIRREAGGLTPDGVLEETASEAVQRTLLPGPIGSLGMVWAANQRYAEAGVTTTQSGLTPEGLLTTLSWLGRLGLLRSRLVIWPDEHAAEAMIAGDYRPPRVSPAKVQLGAVKLLADGSIQGYTGYLREPYTVPPEDDPEYRGAPRQAPEALTAQVVALHTAGMQLAIHGNGDAAIDNILDAIAAAQAAHPRDDARHIIVHAQLADIAQLDRMAELGVTPTFFAQHTHYWGDRHRTLFLGPERAERLDPVASAAARGLHPTVHADVPILPMDPLELMAVAMTRQTRSGVVLGEGERLGAVAALRAVTADVAWQQHLDDRGQLAAGMRADFVVLSASPLQHDPASLVVEQTVVGGEVVFSQEKL